MLIYHILYQGKDWDVCVKIDTYTMKHYGFFIREWNTDEDSVCRFDRI